MKTLLTIILGLSLGGLLAQAADGEAKPKPAPALPDWVKKYDKNGDGKLDEAERKAMAEERRKERDEAIAKRQAEQKKQEPKPEEKK